VRSRKRPGAGEAAPGFTRGLITGRAIPEPCPYRLTDCGERLAELRDEPIVQVRATLMEGSPDRVGSA
jgi:hypothetical protein